MEKQQQQDREDKLRAPPKQEPPRAPVAVEMEAPITEEDLIRAGGLGARDDLDSIVPLAMDCTDFESNMRAAEEYEGELIATPKPGLGLKQVQEAQPDEQAPKQKQ